MYLHTKASVNRTGLETTAEPGVQLLAFPVSVFFRFLMTSVFILMVLEVLRKSRFIANYRQQLAFGQPRNIQYIEQSWTSPHLFHSRLVH